MLPKRESHSNIREKYLSVVFYLREMCIFNNRLFFPTPEYAEPKTYHNNMPSIYENIFEINITKELNYSIYL